MQAKFYKVSRLFKAIIKRREKSLPSIERWITLLRLRDSVFSNALA